MLIDGAMYGGKCACGKEHAMETRAAVIERGALDQFEEYMSAYGPAGKALCPVRRQFLRGCGGKAPEGGAGDHSESEGAPCG